MTSHDAESNSNEDETEINLALETWKKSIDVQEHFNEICMKIRNFYITIISALLALIGVIVSRLSDPYFSVSSLEVHTSIPVILSIFLATLLFYFVDRHWYHRLLLGAVLNAASIEKEYANKIPGLTLTKVIGEQSPLDVSKKGLGSFFWYWIGRAFGSDNRIKESKKIHSDAKISIFYKSVAAIFLVVLILICIGGGVRVESEAPPPENAATEQEPT